MSILSILGISDAYAATAGAAAPAHSGSLLSLLPMLLIFAVLIFFMMRPQMKRAKEHKALMANLSIGDEIVTAGGIVGRLTKLRDNYVSIAIAKGIEITMQKASISTVLPKGTIDSLD